MSALPLTHFEKFDNNPVEKIFAGRLNIISATAQYYYSKTSLIQRLVHQVKYKTNKDLGLQLGRLMGDQLMQSSRIKPEAIIPLPLYAARQRKRGYNQAELLALGIGESMKIPVLPRVIIRPDYTETQTRKGRIERWRNIEGKFLLTDPAAISGKHILLVDDVITTGATLESCGMELLKADNTRLSIAALCVASKLA